MAPRYRSFLSSRVATVLVVVALSSLTGLRAAHAVSIVPSIGISQTAQSGSKSETMPAVALRNSFLPKTSLELQVGYRSETYSYAGQSFEMRSIPVTMSLWASPVPMLYAGGGVGEYMQVVKYGNNLFPDQKDSHFGAHLGGGFKMPLVPMAALDFQGRYVFLGEQTNQLTTGKINPSFWTLQAGVAIGF
jgi:hypothetical protein